MSTGVIGTITASVLFALALPNEILMYGSPLLGAIALIPYYVALRAAPTGRSAARLGALFGFLSTVLSNFWLMFFEDYSVWTIGGTAVGYTAYNFLLAGLLWKAIQAKSAWRPVLFALLWTLYEYGKSIGFLGYPWGLAGYPLNSVNSLIQIVDVTGVWGLSFLMLYLNATLAELLSHPSSIRRLSVHVRHAIMVTLLFAATFTYGLFALSREIPIENRTNLLLIQQNVDMWQTGDIPGALNTLQEQTLEAVETSDIDLDLVIWSEQTLRYLYERDRSWYQRNPSQMPFTEFLGSLPGPLLTGAPYYNEDRDEFYNAALLIGQDASVSQWYGKQQLVPFAELIPFFEYEFVRAFFGNVIGLRATWSRGPGYRLFEIPGENGTVTSGTPICFEDGFARVTAGFVKNGADLLINLTNNSWSRTDSAQTQHFVAARFRAIETRRTLVRSSNSGYTGVIDPWGRVTDSLPMFEARSLAVTVPVYVPERESVYLIWGDYLPQAILLLFVVLTIRSFIKKEVPKHPSF